MRKTVVFVDNPPRIRTTLTSETGVSLSDEQPLDEAEEEAQGLVDMIRQRRANLQKEH